MRSRERAFWQAHYYDFNVSSNDKFVEKLRYIHRNPVRRGLVARPEDWTWSSFRHYQTGVVEPSRSSQGGRHNKERVATRVDGIPVGLPGPQKRGTGGTLDRMR
ncbi:MAG TPA: hypothetical protein VGD64_04430 [Acidisarcina sp.]